MDRTKTISTDAAVAQSSSFALLSASGDRSPGETASTVGLGFQKANLTCRTGRLRLKAIAKSMKMKTKATYKEAVRVVSMIPKEGTTSSELPSLPFDCSMGKTSDDMSASMRRRLYNAYRWTLLTGKRLQP